MSLPIFQRTIVDSSGNIQPGASVAVRNETTGDLVAIYADREGGTAKANPFLADAEGFATFYVEPGEYQVTATTPAGTITWSHVAIGDTALLQLAQPTGDTLVGSDDGASGSLWTNVAGFLTHLKSTAGAAIAGFSWAALPTAVNNVDWGIQTAGNGVNVWRYIPPGEWAEIKAGTSIYDCKPAFTTAMAAHKSIFVPQGAYKVTNTVEIPSGVTVYGVGPSSIISGDGIEGDLVRFGPDEVATSNCCLKNIALAGSATTAVSVNYAINCEMNSVHVIGTFTDGFKFNVVFPGKFSNLYCNGAAISNACFTFLDEVNACLFDNLYTSNFSTYNFLLNGTGHGNVFNNPSAQGGRYGFFIKKGFASLTVNGLYTENCVRPIVAGTRGSPGTGGASAVVFNGPYLGGPELTHPHYLECIAAIELNDAVGVTINNPLFIGTSRQAGGYPTVTITGDGSGALAWARVSPTGTVVSVEVLTPGSGYTTATATITGGGGSGAVLSTTVTAGAIGSIAVTAPGTGYKRTQTPMAVVYDSIYNCSINNGVCSLPVLGNQVPLYPLVGRYSPTYVASTLSISDVSVRQRSYGVAATVQTAGGANGRMLVRESNWDGTAYFYTYQVPVFP